MKRKLEDIWDIFGNFGHLDGEAQESGDILSAETGGLHVETTVEVGEAGVSHRRTIVRNVSDKSIEATCLLDLFQFDGGLYEVYTQANTWMDESRGAWQPLHTAVEARGGGMRTSSGAAPVLALWNARTGTGRVFHLMSDAVWEMRAVAMPDGSHIVVETGMDSRHLRLVLKPGEEVALPEVVSYDFTNKTDLDCHKLHAWWNAKYPCGPLPSFYNTWLCRFDKLDFDFVVKQVARAAELGLDYFVIDAGWFGPAARWTSTRGDWKERPDGWLHGRLAALADAVRAAGLKFGLWLEAETAADESEVAKSHSEFFRRLGGGLYIDFTRDDARAHLLDTIDTLVAKYGVAFIKFDFNCDPVRDPSGADFADYNAGYRRFLREVRARHPDLYLEGCASGGLMMDLGWARDFDSCWPSDNQSPLYGLRIAKETMLRLPPHKIERWITVRSVSGLQPDYFGHDDRLLATEDAWWRDMRSLTPAFVAAFATGGPVGFSCDLTALSDDHLAFFRELLTAHRRDEAFWREAVGRILSDTPEIVALQFSDAALTDVRVVVATVSAFQQRVTIRPVLNPSRNYDCGGHREGGSALMAHGAEATVEGLSATELHFHAQ